MLTPLTAGVTLAGSVATETYSELMPFQLDRSSDALERRYTDETSQFIEFDDLRMHYRDEGPRDGQVLLALHGTCSSLHTWDGWTDHLSDDFRVIRIDMPGFGLTGPREGEHTLERVIESIGVFCDELGLEDIAVAGNSLGGGVAWRLSVARPDLVDRLVLVDPGGASLLSHIARHYRTLGTDILTRYATPRVAVRMLLRDAYGDTSKVTESLVNRYYDLLLRTGNRRAVMTLASNYHEDHFSSDGHSPRASGPVLPSTTSAHPSVLDDHDISDVSVPTFFQWGSEDSWLSESFGRELSDQVPNSEFVVYEGIGHVPMEEAPGPTAADVATFLES